MRIKGIDIHDKFGDGHVFWMAVEDVSNKYEEEAKVIDGENYSDGCFGICIVCDEEAEKFAVVYNGSEERQMYYIDNDGNKNWFPCIIEDSVISEAIKLCREGIKN